MAAHLPLCTGPVGRYQRLDLDHTIGSHQVLQRGAHRSSGQAGLGTQGPQTRHAAQTTQRATNVSDHVTAVPRERNTRPST